MNWFFEQLIKKMQETDRKRRKSQKEQQKKWEKLLGGEYGKEISDK